MSSKNSTLDVILMIVMNNIIKLTRKYIIGKTIKSENNVFIIGATSGMGKVTTDKFINEGNRNEEVVNIFNNVTPIVVDGTCNIVGINDHSYPLLDDRWDLVMDINLKVPFKIIREVLALIIDNGGGSITIGYVKIIFVVTSFIQVDV